jgi:hypothetical protein
MMDNNEIVVVCISAAPQLRNVSGLSTLLSEIGRRSTANLALQLGLQLVAGALTRLF